MFPVLILATAMMTLPSHVLRLSATDTHQTSLRWQVVNDTVMGGRSASRFAARDGHLEFSGYLNTNGGGFASLRSNRLNLDLAGVASVRLKVLGDGRRYRFRLFVDNDRASYQQEFETSAGEWRMVELPLAQFYASWRGRPLSRPALDPADIVAMGLILADGVDGEFRIGLDWIEFVRSPSSQSAAVACTAPC